jgi:hypothetical protein
MLTKRDQGPDVVHSLLGLDDAMATELRQPVLTIALAATRSIMCAFLSQNCLSKIGS